MQEDEVCFERDTHAYMDNGVRRMSTTQAIKIAGLIDYSMVPPDVLQRAANRGTLVHQASVLIDGGADLNEYDVPAECVPYIQAYCLFLRETGFIPDHAFTEKPRIAEIAGQRVGMTPDRVGLLDGVPTVLELKTCSAAHPSWGVQTAGYEMGLPRPARCRNYQRVAVQLMKTGKYKLWPYEDQSDFDIFCDAFRVAQWKVKHKISKLD